MGDIVLHIILSILAINVPTHRATSSCSNLLLYEFSLVSPKPRFPEEELPVCKASTKYSCSEPMLILLAFLQYSTVWLALVLKEQSLLSVRILTYRDMERLTGCTTSSHFNSLADWARWVNLRRSTLRRAVVASKFLRLISASRATSLVRVRCKSQSLLIQAKCR